MPKPSKSGRTPRARTWALALLAAGLLPAGSSAQAPTGWLGKRVITKFGAPLQVDGRVIDNEKLENSPRGGQRRTARIYRAEQTNGPWIWIKDEKSGIAGWVTAEWLIPYDQAIDYFTNQIRANPGDASAYMSRGHIWKDKKEYDIALADYTEAIRLDPGGETCWVSRGDAWQDKKEYDKAIADYTEAIRLDPKYALAYSNRGVAWEAKKEYDKAIADSTEAIRLDPKSTYPYFYRSVARMILRRGEIGEGFKAVLDLEKGKGDLSTYAVILGHLAARRAGDEGEARWFLGRAGDLDGSAWPFPVVKFLEGGLDEAGLLALAVDDDKRTEARCFLGLDSDLKGSRDRALDHYRWVRDHGTTTFTEYAIALAELERLEGAAATPGPAPTPSPSPAAPATFAGTVLYVPTPEVEGRFGADPKPLGDYVDALMGRALAILAEADAGAIGAKGLLVAVGLKSGGRSKVWCQAVDGEVPAPLLRTLERELGEVKAVELKRSPAGFALKFRLNGGEPGEFPVVPDRWKDASLSTRSKVVIPPDDLFRILWPD